MRKQQCLLARFSKFQSLHDSTTCVYRQIWSMANDDAISFSRLNSASWHTHGALYPIFSTTTTVSSFNLSCLFIAAVRHALVADFTWRT